MIQFSNKHRGDAVQCSAAFAGYGFERMCGAEVRRGQYHGRAMADTSQISKHHPETMVERNGNTEPVLMSKPHALGDPKAIVKNIVMGERRALRKSGRPRGILNVDSVVEIQAGLPLGKQFRCS